MTALESKPTHVYRLFSELYVPLYVGIAANVESRLQQHRYRDRWWGEVRHTHTDQYRTRAEAKLVEQIEVVIHGPRYNIMWIPRWDAYALGGYDDHLDEPHVEIARLSHYRRLRMLARELQTMVDDFEERGEDAAWVRRYVELLWSEARTYSSLSDADFAELRAKHCNTSRKRLLSQPPELRAFGAFLDNIGP